MDRTVTIELPGEQAVEVISALGQYVQTGCAPHCRWTTSPALPVVQPAG